MSIERVKSYLHQWGKDAAIQEFAVSSATVELAAQALGVAPARIAKSIAFAAADGPETGCILIVTAGDSKVNGSRFRQRFGHRATMMQPAQTLFWTGYQVGGVCPFAIDSPEVSIYLDVSLKRFDVVFPACGSSNSVVAMTCDELMSIAKAAGWVDIGVGWQGDGD